MDEMELSVNDFREVRIPLQYRGDEMYEWAGGFVPDLDLNCDKWNVD
jgi:hypothetical protein